METMRLKILTATQTVVEQEAIKVSAESPAGSYTLLPRHIDFVALQAPGLVSYRTPEGDALWVAVDEGLVVKKGDQVRIAVREAVSGESLQDLERTVTEHFLVRDESEKRARAATARLEADFVRRFLEVEQHV